MNFGDILLALAGLTLLPLGIIHFAVGLVSTICIVIASIIFILWIGGGIITNRQSHT